MQDEFFSKLFSFEINLCIFVSFYSDSFTNYTWVFKETFNFNTLFLMPIDFKFEYSACFAFKCRVHYVPVLRCEVLRSYQL